MGKSARAEAGLTERKELDISHFHVLISRKAFSATSRHMCYLGPSERKNLCLFKSVLLLGTSLREIGYLFISFTFGLAT